MSGTKSIIRIILSLLGLALGIVVIVNALKLESADYIRTAIGALISIFSLGWLFNLRFAKVVTGILFIPSGAAGSLWTVWDFFQEILFDKGVIGNHPILGYNMTVVFWPYVVVLALFVWIFIMGIEFVKGEKR